MQIITHLTEDTFEYLLQLFNDSEEIDQMMRDNESIDEILKITNERILKQGYGLSSSEIKLADNIWKKLSKRRLNRNGR